MPERKKDLSTTDRKLSMPSFIPEKNRLRYAHIKPGIYLFVQDKDSNEIFLWNTNSGHGHPFLANLVNRDLRREEDDFSWVGAAGEIIFGNEIMGLSYCTGFFHEALKLSEPEEIEDYG